MNIRRTHRIVAKDISQSHPHKKSYKTDAFYARLANQLFEGFQQICLDLGENTCTIERYAAILLANYMEDIVTDSGQWRSFSELCKQMFGYPVPLYHNEDEEYYPDEPSFAAVRFIVWHAANEMDDVWWNADTNELFLMAQSAYSQLDNAFETSPINNELTDDITVLLQKASSSFQALRPVLIWVFSECYLTRSLAAENLIENRLNETTQMNEFMHAESMRMFYAIMHSIFLYKIGPLALQAKDYLASMMRGKQMQKEAQAVEEIEVLPMSHYQYSIEEDGKWLQLLSTSGQQLRVCRDELTLDDQKLREYDGCIAIFIKYIGLWCLNGVMIPTKNTAAHWDEFVRKDPNYKPEGTVDLTGKMLLQMTGGRQILYFADKEELEHYLLTELHYQPEHFDFLNHKDILGLHPLIFVDKDAEKYALHFSFVFTPCIADPENPYYDASVAQKEAFEMFYNEKSISTNTILYLLEHNYLPDIYDDKIFCQNNSAEEKRKDALFLLRYIRRENY